MRNAEALKQNDNYENLEGKRVSELSENLAEKQEKNVLSLEAGQIRKDLLDRMGHDRGVFSADETQFWQQRIKQSHNDVEELKSVKEEFEEQWKRSQQLRKEFEQHVKSAQREGFLKREEPQTLEELFLQNSLEEKEIAEKEFEREIAERKAQLKEQLSQFEKPVQELVREELKSTKDFEEKLSVLKEGEETNENFRKYKKILESHKSQIGEHTLKSFCKWFLTLSKREQINALDNVYSDKKGVDGIKPRIRTWEIHHSLPREYQTENFKKWGLQERKNYLKSTQKKIEREYNNALRKAGDVFSRASIEACRTAFNQEKEDIGNELLWKIQLLKFLPKHIKAEERLWDQFEKLPAKIQELLGKEFEEGDFDKKKEILTSKGRRMADRYKKVHDRMKKLDEHVMESYEEDIEDSHTIEMMEKMATEAEAFQRSKTNYFKKWSANQKYFNSDVKIYQDWYEESVDSLAVAKVVEHELDLMINERKKVYQGIQKLPTHLRKRVNMDTSFSEREEQFEKYKEVAKEYRSNIPFYLAKAEKLENQGENQEALEYYVQALKLDPENKEIQTLSARLRQQRTKFPGKSANKEDADRTKEILEKVDQTETLSGQAEQVARERLMLLKAKQYVEHTGATGTTVEARARKSIESFEEEDKETATTIREELGDKYTVNREEEVEEVLTIEVDKDQQTKGTQSKIFEYFDRKKHKGGVGEGAANVKFATTSGNELELNTAKQALDKKTERIESQRRHLFLIKIKSDKSLGLTPQQEEAILKNFDAANQTSLVEENQETLAA
ncbi:MAG: hypothetical protein ACD_28C00143G0008 [uncultured bacterium]|nr:MAG: hypothetical protein ACD_28C00143G0008 [uncultured bacterium]KKT77036.1 MAG: hypothetical protein UW70_C0005G0016 [Candidatus Peregrinibacteria bacterium GW2011_GWA2_44_7]